MIVDSHIHYFDSPGFVDSLIREMDDVGVDKAVLLPTLEDSTWEYVGLTFRKVDTEAVIEACRQYPDRLVGAIRLDPTADSALEEFLRYADEDCIRLLKLSPTEGFRVDDHRAWPLYEECAKRGFPVLIHIGQTGGTFIGEKLEARYQLNSAMGHPLQVDTVAKAFPDVAFIIAHNGYPYKIESWAAAYDNPNVYLDMAGSGPWVDGTPSLYTALGQKSFIPINLDRVLWGCDNCLPISESMTRCSAYLRLMGAGKAQRALAFGGIAARLYRL